MSELLQIDAEAADATSPAHDLGPTPPATWSAKVTAAKAARWTAVKLWQDIGDGVQLDRELTAEEAAALAAVETWDAALAVFGVSTEGDWMGPKEEAAEGRAELDLDAIEARERAATPGPWAWESVSHDANEWCLGVTYPAREGQIVETFDESTQTYSEKPDVVEHIASNGTNGTFADARFIASARTDIPALILARADARADVNRLLRALKASEEAHATTRECMLANAEELVRADGIIGELRAELTREREEVARVRAALTEALDGWEYAATYKMAYHRRKHGDDVDIARLRALVPAVDDAAAPANAPAPPSPCADCARMVAAIHKVTAHDRGEDPCMGSVVLRASLPVDVPANAPASDEGMAVRVWCAGVVRRLAERYHSEHSAHAIEALREAERLILEGE